VMTSPARRSIGATCRGRPCRRLPAAPKFHRRRANRRWLRATSLWARARAEQLALPERTSGQSALVCRPARRAPPSRRDPHPANPTPPRRLKERPASARQLYDGSDRPDSVSLQRRRSRGKSSDSASTSVLPAAEPSAAPDVHVSLVTGGGHGPTPATTEAGGSALERAGERVATVEAAGRSGVALESAGSKHVAPEQGSSDRPVKKAWVRSKM
jgi:hypothetical protein